MKRSVKKLFERVFRDFIHSGKDLRSCWELLRPHRPRVSWILALIAGVTGLEVFRPIAYRWIVDHVVISAALSGDEKIRILWTAGGILGAIMIMGAFGHWLRLFQSAQLNYKITAELRLRLLKRMLLMPLDEARKMSTGGAVSRLNHDTSLVSQIVERAILEPSAALLQIVVTLIVIFVVNPLLFAVGIAVVIPLVVVTHYVSVRARPFFDAVLEDEAVLSSRTAETFAGLRTIRVFGREKDRERVYAKTLHGLIRNALLAKRFQIALGSGWMFIVSAIQITIVIVGGILVSTGKATIGDVFAVSILSVRVFGPFSQLSHSFDQLQENLAALSRVTSLLNSPVCISGNRGKNDIPETVRTFEVSGVTVRHNDRSDDILSNISMGVKGGETVAIVGRSGAGKTTLLDCIAGLRIPDKGAIYINGINLREIKSNDYRRILGVVDQDVFLFAGSIRENIAFGRPTASISEIEVAAKKANAHEFIVTFPNGYETEVGERGGRLSGGQRQRIGLARAFLLDPKILLMDEATSQLDVESEADIRDALKLLGGGRITFIVTHRLNGVRNADKIIVIEKGRVEEEGTHNELRTRNGFYEKAVGIDNREESV